MGNPEQDKKIDGKPTGNLLPHDGYAVGGWGVDSQLPRLTTQAQAHACRRETGGWGV